MSLDNISSYFPPNWVMTPITEQIIIDTSGMYDFSNKIHVWKGVGDKPPLWISANDVTVMNFILDNNTGQNGIKITNCTPDGSKCITTGPNNIRLQGCMGISSSDYLIATPKSGSNYIIDSCVLFSKNGKAINLNNVFSVQISGCTLVSGLDSIIANGNTSGSIVNNTFFIPAQYSVLATQNINSWSLSNNTTNQVTQRQITQQPRASTLTISISIGAIILLIIIIIIIILVFKYAKK
jgi:hypothetical protein